MPAVWVTPADLSPFLPSLSEATAQALIQAAVSNARRIAPCIDGDHFPDNDERIAKDVIVQAIIRRHTVMPGVSFSRSVGAVSESIDGTGLAAVPFLQSEVDMLRALCRAQGESVGGQQPIYAFPPASCWPA